jgi:hypothetical protein
MQFIDILKNLQGAYVFLGLVDLTDISGEIKSITDTGEIVLEIGENDFVENQTHKIAVELVEYVLLLNPPNN